MQKSPITIVQLTANDWKAYKDIYLASMQEAPTAYPNSYEEANQQTAREWRARFMRSRVLFFAKENDQLVGMLGVELNDKIKIRHFVGLISFYVRSTHQGKGIGTKLMKAVMEYLHKQPHIIKIESTVYRSQKASLAIHKKFGFKKVGIQHKHLKIGNTFYDQIYFEKFIR